VCIVHHCVARSTGDRQFCRLAEIQAARQLGRVHEGRDDLIVLGLQIPGCRRCGQIPGRGWSWPSLSPDEITVNAARFALRNSYDTSSLPWWHAFAASHETLSREILEKVSALLKEMRENPAMRFSSAS